MAWQFATFTLALQSPLHVGAGRAGMIARCRRLVPGHVFSYALAASIGAARGGDVQHFRAALGEVLECTRFGPGFVLGHDGAMSGWVERSEVLVRGDSHVALDFETRSAVEGALYETETLGHRHADGAPVRVGAGVWLASATLHDRPLDHWLGDLRLGGELKAGCGRTELAAWKVNASDYHGWGTPSVAGLHVAAGTRLHGPALDGADALVGRSPLEPWLGRMFDYENASFGTRLSEVAMIRQNDHVTRDSVWIPHAKNIGLGCWTTI